MREMGRGGGREGVGGMRERSEGKRGRERRQTGEMEWWLGAVKE